MSGGACRTVKGRLSLIVFCVYAATNLLMGVDLTEVHSRRLVCFWDLLLQMHVEGEMFTRNAAVMYGAFGACKCILVLHRAICCFGIPGRLWATHRSFPVCGISPSKSIPAAEAVATANRCTNCVSKSRCCMILVQPTLHHLAFGTKGLAAGSATHADVSVLNCCSIQEQAHADCKV